MACPPIESLECPAERLLALDRLEQCLKMALPEAPGPAALDHLKEQGRPVGDRLRKDLQHVALVVPVNEAAEVGEYAEVLADVADSLRQHLIIRLRHAE